MRLRIRAGGSGHEPPGQEVRLCPARNISKRDDKEQRMYEHVNESELDAGRSTKEAKSIAAATVVKQHNEEKHAPNK